MQLLFFKQDLGYTACEILFERIAAPNGSVKSMLLETELIVRESTALLPGHLDTTGPQW